MRNAHAFGSVRAAPSLHTGRIDEGAGQIHEGEDLAEKLWLKEGLLEHTQTYLKFSL